MAGMTSENVREVLYKYGQDVTFKMAQVLKGTLLGQKISFRVVETPGGPELKVRIPEYGVYVDEGRKPWGKYKNTPLKNIPRSQWNKFPPINEISNWANSRRIRFNTVTDFSSGPSKLVYSNKGFIKNKTRDFLIARSIAARGIKPRPFVHFFYDGINGLLKDMEAGAATDFAISLQEGFNSAGIGDA